MSRLRKIMENHDQLEQLNAVLKHYSVNAEFVTASIIEALNNGNQEQDDNQAPNEELITDLRQLFSTY